MSDEADATRTPSQWALGKSKTPGPPPSRERLGEAFLAELMDSWVAQGRKAIAEVIEKKPDVYLRIVASVGLAPMKERADELDDLDDAELNALIVAARGALKACEPSGGAGDGES